MRIGNRVVTLVAAGVLLAMLPLSAVVQAGAPSTTRNSGVGDVAFGLTSAQVRSVTGGVRATSQSTSFECCPRLHHRSGADEDIVEGTNEVR